MISSPRIGQRVQVHYAKRAAAFMPHHGRIGAVIVTSRGPGPRNHAIDFGGTVAVVPSGNLRIPKESTP